MNSQQLADEVRSQVEEAMDPETAIRLLCRENKRKLDATMDEVEEATRLAMRRILGIGADQYADNLDQQRFEAIPIEKLHEYLDEELLDMINYSVMTRIRYRRLLDEATQIFSGSWTPSVTFEATNDVTFELYRASQGKEVWMRITDQRPWTMNFRMTHERAQALRALLSRWEETP